MNEINLNENEEIYHVVCWISCLCSQHIDKLSTMTQDAMVYKLTSFFFFVRFLFLIVAQLELRLTPFTEDPSTFKLHKSNN